MSLLLSRHKGDRMIGQRYFSVRKPEVPGICFAECRQPPAAPRFGRGDGGDPGRLQALQYVERRIELRGQQLFARRENLEAEVAELKAEGKTLRAERTVCGADALSLYHEAMVYLVPLVNPDGADLAAGAIAPGSAEYCAAAQIAAQFPDVPFPSGWKANLSGVDLNLNYPARWEEARSIKAAKGFGRPAPRDYPGGRPLDQPETAALAAYAACIRPDLMLALHTQGRVIYPGPVETAPEGSEALAKALAAASGYAVEDVPAESANAGFKDWFLQVFKRPAFTIEAGLGENPLPTSQLPEITRALSAIFTAAMQW